MSIGPARRGVGALTTRVVVAALLVSMVILAVPRVGPTAAQTPEPPLTTGSSIPDAGQGIPPIIPEPNSGEAPDDPGDRGGWQQLAVLGVVLGGLGVIVVLVARDARWKRMS